MREDLNKRNKIIYTSSPEWSTMLVNNKLINHCPIYAAAFNALNSSSIGLYIIPWIYINYTKDIEKEILEKRTSLNICNGIGYVMNPSKNVRESLGFAGDVDDKNFHLKISDRKYVSKCISIIRTTLFSNQNDLLLFDQKKMCKLLEF